VIGDASCAKEFYRYQAEHTRLRDAGMGRMVEMLLGQCLGVHDVEWKRVRRPFLHPFSAGSVNAHHPALVAATNRWLEATMHKSEVDLASLMLVPFDLFAQLVYVDLSPEDLRELHEMQVLHDHAIGDGLGLLAQLLPSLAMPTRNVLAFQARWTAFNNRFLAKYAEGKLDQKSIFYQVAQGRGAEDGGSGLSNTEVNCPMKERKKPRHLP
jgi:cytochrome P450